MGLANIRELVALIYLYTYIAAKYALEHVAERVSELVYLDAFVPGDRQAVVDITGLPAERNSSRHPCSRLMATGSTSSGRFPKYDPG